MVVSRTRPAKVISGWETIRFELLNTRICDMGLRIEDSPLEIAVARVLRELSAKGMKFRPAFYLSDSWGCPNGVPAIGIPFYLADSRLWRIEEEQVGWAEDNAMLLALLRHEMGHAVNYAYRLWKRPDWIKKFGRFTKPYREKFRPNPFSRHFVRHLVLSEYGNLYAQKHPDEDFAETFAVWLTPRAGWRRRYRLWPAIRKLEYIDELMRTIRSQPPKKTGGRLVNPVEKLDMLLVEHYGQRLERYRAAAQGYVDDRLRQVFPPVKGRATMSVSDLLRKYDSHLSARIAEWSQLTETDAAAILAKLQERAEALKLEFPRSSLSKVLLDIASLSATLSMDFAYTGRFMG